MARKARLVAREAGPPASFKCARFRRTIGKPSCARPIVRIRACKCKAPAPRWDRGRRRPGVLRPERRASLSCPSPPAVLPSRGESRRRSGTARLSHTPTRADNASEVEALPSPKFGVVGGGGRRRAPSPRNGHELRPDATAPAGAAWLTPTVSELPGVQKLACSRRGSVVDAVRCERDTALDPRGAPPLRGRHRGPPSCSGAGPLWSGLFERGDREGEPEPDRRRQADQLAAAGEGLWHHRVGQHREDGPGREREDECDRAR